MVLDTGAGWAYWNLFQSGVLLSLHMFPVYIGLGTLFLIGALVRRLRKRPDEYYWGLGIIIIAIPLIAASGLAMLNN